MSTAMIYAEFATREAHDVSPAYERLSVVVSRDREMIARLDTLVRQVVDGELDGSAALERLDRIESRPTRRHWLIRLAAYGVHAELISLEDSVAHLRLSGPSDVAIAAVRRAVEDAAPELSRVDVEEPPGPLVTLRVSGASP